MLDYDCRIFRLCCVIDLPGKLGVEVAKNWKRMDVRAGEKLGEAEVKVWILMKQFQFQ